MTLEELDVSLPNGLHDAQIERMDIDYLHARLTLSVQVLFGLPAQPDSAREEYRVGALMFHGVQFVSIEFPPARIGLSAARRTLVLIRENAI